MPAARTAVGRGLVALLRGGADLTARRGRARVRARRRGSPGPNDADWLERAMRRRGLRDRGRGARGLEGPAPLRVRGARPAPAQPTSSCASIAGLVASGSASGRTSAGLRSPSARSASSCAPPRIAAEALEALAELRGDRGARPRGARDPGGPRGAAVARADRGTRSSDQPLPGSRPARRPPVRRLAAGRRVPPPRRGRRRSSPTSSAARSDCRRGPRPTTRSAICSTSASRARRAASTSAGEAATTKGRRPRARRSWTTSAICSPRRRPADGDPDPLEPADAPAPARRRGASRRRGAQHRRAGALARRLRGTRVTTARRRPSSGWTPTTLGGWPRGSRRRPPGSRRKRLEPGPLERARGASTSCELAAVRRLDARGVRPLLLPLVRPARAEPTAARAGARGPRPGLCDPRRPRGALPRAARRRASAPPRDAPRVAPRAPASWSAPDAGEHGLGGDDARGDHLSGKNGGADRGLPRARGGGPQSVRADRSCWRRASARTRTTTARRWSSTGFGLHGKIDRVDVPATGGPPG